MMSNIVELIKHRITPMDSEHRDINITRTFHRDDYEGLDAVIDSLKREKKLRKIWENFEDLYGQSMIPVEGNRTLIKKLMVDLEIKNEYFPEEETNATRNDSCT